jgi:hypothetical protein
MRNTVPDSDEQQTKIKLNCLNCVDHQSVSVYGQDLKAWKEGANPRDVFPYLAPDQIELLISGLCANCQTSVRTDSDEQLI